MPYNIAKNEANSLIEINELPYLFSLGAKPLTKGFPETSLDSPDPLIRPSCVVEKIP